MRALIVDPDAAFSDALSSGLEELGVHVENARSAAEAVAAFARNCIDVVILDFSLSGSARLDLVASLAARPNAPKIIVIIKENGVAGALGAMVARSLDVQNVLFKPVDASELLSSLNAPHSPGHGRVVTG